MTSGAADRTRDDNRRQSIIDAAARIFAENGFSGTSNREIAREAGISPGLIYWYFTDKDELFMEVLRSLFPLRVLEMPDEGPDVLPLTELLDNVARQFLEIMTHPDVLRMIRIALAELLRFPDLRRQIGQMIASNAIGRLASQLERRIQSGEVAPINTHLAAQSFFGSLIGFVLRKYIFQSEDLAEIPDIAMIETTVRIHAGGMKAGISESS